MCQAGFKASAGTILEQCLHSTFALPVLGCTIRELGEVKYAVTIISRGRFPTTTRTASPRLPGLSSNCFIKVVVVVDAVQRAVQDELALNEAGKDR